MKALSHMRLGVLASALAAVAMAAEPGYRLEVASLACPFCAYGIEKKVIALEGVESVETHIKDGAVIVRMKEGAMLDEAVARQAVQAAGFTLEAFEPVSAASSEAGRYWPIRRRTMSGTGRSTST